MVTMLQIPIYALEYGNEWFHLACFWLFMHEKKKIKMVRFNGCPAITKVTLIACGHHFLLFSIEDFFHFFIFCSTVLYSSNFIIFLDALHSIRRFSTSKWINYPHCEWIEPKLEHHYDLACVPSKLIISNWKCD